MDLIFSDDCNFQIQDQEGGELEMITWLMRANIQRISTINDIYVIFVMSRYEYIL